MARILIAVGSFAHGGAERHAITLVNRLGARRHECHAVYIKSQVDQLDRLRLCGGGTVRCLEATRYFDIHALARFSAFIADTKPSIIVAANPYALMYSTLALGLSRLSLPVMVTYHSTKLLGAKEQLQMMAYRILFWMADCSVFVCETQRRRWLFRGVFSRRNEVIYNGVDTDEFCATRIAENLGSLREALGFAETDYVIGIAAGLRPEKNHVQLIDAVAALRKMGLPARALLIGDGEMRGAIETRARMHGLGTDIVITGFQRDVRPYIAICDVMTLCSVTEALSLAAIEAMALGKPVVHSDVGGAAELITPGRNGFLFPVGDTAAFVERLAILADRTVSSNMGHHAREIIEMRFSENTMVDRYEQVLLQLCRDRPAFMKRRPLEIQDEVPARNIPSQSDSPSGRP